MCIRSGGGSLVGGGGSPGSLNLPRGAGLCQALSRAEGKIPAIMERAAMRDQWRVGLGQISGFLFSKVVFNAFSFVFLTWEANGSRLCVHFPFRPAQCHLPPAKASTPFRSSPAHFTHSYSFPALYPTPSSRDQQLYLTALPRPPICFERRALNIELTSSLKVGILLLGTWCYFLFLPKFLNWMSFPTEIQT